MRHNKRAFREKGLDSGYPAEFWNTGTSCKGSPDHVNWCDNEVANAAQSDCLVSLEGRQSSSLPDLFSRLLLETILLMLLIPALCHAGADLRWQAGTGYRFAPVTPAQTGRIGFKLLAPGETGVVFTNLLHQSRYITNQIYLNGSGVAAGDIDGDGWCDLFFCAIDGSNVLYRNLGGWRFEDITASAGVPMPGMSSSGATFADLDGDGDLDLIVNTVGNGTHIFANDGKGHFSSACAKGPLNYLRAGMTVALADTDGDGDLDLYVSNYRTTTVRDMPNTRLTINDTPDGLVVVEVNGRPATDPDLVGRFTVTRDGRYRENGEPDAFYLNDGSFNFTFVPFTGGRFLDEDGKPLRSPLYDWGLSVTFRDLTGDMAPDIYVCNDFESPDRIWINDGKGGFRAIHRLALRHTSIFSMSVDVADINRDGFFDIVVSDMLSRDHAKRMLETGEIEPTFLPIGAIDNRPQYSHNMLFLNRGDGTYAEISQYAGVQASEWTWSPNFLDVDLDGYEDIVISTGHELQMMNGDIIARADAMKVQRQMSGSELQRLRVMFPRYNTPNVAFRNRGNLTFADVSDEWGFNNADVGNAMAMADLDNDGDLDVVINNLNGVAEVYRNDTDAPRVAVRLRGRPPNTQGIGARIEVFGGPVPVQSQEMICGGRYLSGAEALRVFAAGAMTNRLTIQVTWRDGTKSVVSNALPNHIYEVDQSHATPCTPDPNQEPQPLFEDVSFILNHRHHEDPFDDFGRQPLMPHKLSQMGPGVSWIDIDGDGADDLVIGSGRGGKLACYLNRSRANFVLSTNAVFTRTVARDQTSILAVGATLIVGSSNYEDGLTNGGYIRIYDVARSMSGESVTGPTCSTGPLALADVDADGSMELFIGGRAVPGRYPEPADSVLLKTEGGRMSVARRFAKLGMVSGAVFSDLDNDGFPELVLACDWGPIRVFRNQRGELTEWDPPIAGELPPNPSDSRTTKIPAGSRLSRLTGWWAGVATGDLDGDGRFDIIVSNWGLNSRYRPSLNSPIWIHYGDIAGSGGVDIIESYVNPATGKEVPRRGMRPVVAVFPFVVEKTDTLEAYGKATVQELFGERLAGAAVVEATTLASVVLFNRGDHFVVVPLPAEAQWSPAFGICIADFDGDGCEDVFLSQNFFAVNPDEWRHDAGRGLLLRGDGRGGLWPVAGQVSGIKVYGEQRGCAVGDYDADGRPDIVVTQNGNETKLFHNVSGKPGLRVRCVGPPGNPTGIGANVRLKFKSGRLGAPREIQSGSGYWSRNSDTMVLATPEPPAEVLVRWPGGQEVSAPIQANAREIALDMKGNARTVR